MRMENTQNKILLLHQCGFMWHLNNGSSNAKKRIEWLLNDDKLFPNQYNHAKNLAKKYLNIEK